MLTRLWNRFGVRINGRPQRRRSLSRAGRLEHLEPRALLAAQVSAAAPMAAQASSNVNDATPKATRPPGAFHERHVVQLGSGRVELRWSGAAGANEIVIKQGRTEIARLDGDETSYQIEGLTSGQRYRFSLVATNARGSRTDPLTVWMPSTSVPTLEEFSIQSNRDGELTLRLNRPWTESQQRLVVRYRVEGSNGTFGTVMASACDGGYHFHRSLSKQRLELFFESQPSLDFGASGVRTEVIPLSAPRG